MSGIDCLFERLDVDRYLPTAHARGPWDPRVAHGGAPAALLAGVLVQVLADAAPDDPQLHPARLTIDLERPLPLVPVTVRSRVARPGRKVRIGEVELLDDQGQRVARATLLGIRRTPDELEYSGARPMVSAAPPPVTASTTATTSPPFAPVVEGPMFHSHAVEHRFVNGEFSTLGPATDWIRLRVAVLADEPIRPLQRVAAAADFGNGVSAALPAGWTFINPDLTVTLHREPVGEWICLDAGTHLGPRGVGTAESALWDETGRIGRSIQSLLIEQPATP